MRKTEENANYLRKVLAQQLGPYALIMSVEDVNKIADILQARVNQRVNQIDSTKYHWLIKIRADFNAEKEWHEIDAEPTSPYCSKNAIHNAANDILEKYPKVINVVVFNVEETTLTLFGRNK